MLSKISTTSKVKEYIEAYTDEAGNHPKRREHMHIVVDEVGTVVYQELHEAGAEPSGQVYIHSTAAQSVTKAQAHRRLAKEIARLKRIGGHLPTGKLIKID